MAYPRRMRCRKVAVTEIPLSTMLGMNMAGMFRPVYFSTAPIQAMVKRAETLLQMTASMVRRVRRLAEIITKKRKTSIRNASMTLKLAPKLSAVKKVVAIRQAATRDNSRTNQDTDCREVLFIP